MTRRFSVENWRKILKHLQDRPDAPVICLLYITIRSTTDPLLAALQKSVEISLNKEDDLLVTDAAADLGLIERVVVNRKPGEICEPCRKKKFYS